MKPLDFLFTFAQIRSLPARLLVNDADYNQIPSSVVVVVVLHHEWAFSLLCGCGGGSNSSGSKLWLRPRTAYELTLGLLTDCALC